MSSDPLCAANFLLLGLVQGSVSFILRHLLTEGTSLLIARLID